jgi:hypothetical protein
MRAAIPQVSHVPHGGGQRVLMREELSQFKDKNVKLFAIDK